MRASHGIQHMSSDFCHDKAPKILTGLLQRKLNVSATFGILRQLPNASHQTRHPTSHAAGNAASNATGQNNVSATTASTTAKVSQIAFYLSRAEQSRQSILHTVLFLPHRSFCANNSGAKIAGPRWIFVGIYPLDQCSEGKSQSPWLRWLGCVPSATRALHHSAATNYELHWPRLAIGPRSCRALQSTQSCETDGSSLTMAQHRSRYLFLAAAYKVVCSRRALRT